MKHVMISSFALFLFLTACAIAQPGVRAKAGPGVSSPNPSLDALVRRVDGYWDALLKKKKSQAAEYVNAADRDPFFNSNIPPFSNPVVRSLEMSKDRKQAIVTVVVMRAMPPYNRSMEWQVKERWSFEKGNWYCSFSHSNSPPIPLDETGASASQVQTEKLKKEIKEGLRFEKQVLDFGTIRESEPLQLSLKYTLSGKESLNAIFRMPAGFGVQGGNEQILSPGEQELLVSVPTWQLDGEVRERIVLGVRRQGVEVPFEIELKGFVYVPISMTPKRLRFQRGENEKEILIRNNSKSDLDLLPIFTETGTVTVESLPRTVSPGQETVLRMKLTKEAAALPSNKLDGIAIPFAKPVDGVNSLSLMVMINVADETGNAGKPTSAPKEEVLIPSDKSKTCRVPPDMK
jgi:hypothetical protein